MGALTPRRAQRLFVCDLLQTRLGKTGSDVSRGALCLLLLFTPNRFQPLVKIGNEVPEAVSVQMHAHNDKKQSPWKPVRANPHEMPEKPQTLLSEFPRELSEEVPECPQSTHEREVGRPLLTFIDTEYSDHLLPDSE